jgi:hypothetical protein
MFPRGQKLNHLHFLVYSREKTGDDIFLLSFERDEGDDGRCLTDRSDSEM